MPKNSKVEKRDGRVIRTRVPHKHRIGSRKSGVSASMMSNDQLYDVLNNVDKKKWHHIAYTVLGNR